MIYHAFQIHFSQSQQRGASTAPPGKTLNAISGASAGGVQTQGHHYHHPPNTVAGQARQQHNVDSSARGQGNTRNLNRYLYRYLDNLSWSFDICEQKNNHSAS